MYSISQRAQTVGNKFISCAMYVAAAIAISFLLQLHLDKALYLPATVDNVKVKSTMKASRSFGSNNKKPKENTRINFDLEADLTKLFNWNTKQVFVYLTAEYPGKSESSGNKVTYWDKIIQSKKDAKISLKNQKSKYRAWDVEKSFRGREAKIRLEWNIQPHVGPLIFGSTVSNSSFVYISESL